MDPGSAIEAPIVGLKVGTDGEALLAELALPSGQGRCGVRLKLTFLHILAGRLAIDQAYSEDLGLHRHLLSASTGPHTPMQWNSTTSKRQTSVCLSIGMPSCP